jgi:hypothetical protein
MPRHPFVFRAFSRRTRRRPRGVGAARPGAQGGVVIMVATGYLSNLEAALDTGI